MTAPQRAKAHFKIINRLGLHARAAAQLVKLASTFPCEITVGHDGQTANAKSVMGVLLLCGAPGTILDVEATGERAEEAIGEIGALIERRFGEPD
jgi:phosphocarrier protein